MFPPEFIPVTLEGMSVITATVLFFMSIGIGFMYQLFKQEIKRINEEIDRTVNDINIKIAGTNDEVSLLFEKIDATNRDITEIKTHVARTLESVEWMKKYMERNDR